ncbi:MAG TPA: DNA polymerase I [Anaerolineaceae bacterium]
MPPTLYLIDGHALAYRTYFALMGASPGGERWRTKSGEPTAGIYGFASVLLRIFEQERPDFLAVAFDTGKTFRHEFYAEYKGTRAKMPDDLRVQIERIRQLVDAFNIPRLEVEGFEADDVLGTVAQQAARQGLGVKIITGDRDLLQLVDERIIVNLAGNKLSEAKDYLAPDVMAYLGVRPDQIVDYKALVGDTSDNIPGVNGIGEKTAISLLQTYPTLKDIYDHLDAIPTRVRTKLEAGRASAEMSWKLAKIITNVPILLDLEKAHTEDFDPAAVEALFRQLEFRSLVDRLMKLAQSYHSSPSASQQLSLFTTGTPVVISAAPIQVETHLVDTPEAMNGLVKVMQDAAWISFDTETTSTDPMRADLVGISIAVKEGEGYYIPVGHKTASAGQLKIEVVLEALRGPMTNPAQKKLGHNLKYDYLMLSRYGLDTTPLALDTMIAEWLIDPGSHNLGLKNMAWTRMGIQMTHIEDLIGKGKNQITMADVPVEAAARYAAADAETTLRLKPGLEADLAKYKVADLLDKLEMPLIPFLADMERAGIALDIPFLKTMSVELSQRMLELEKQVFNAAGSPFNLNSTQQLAKVLFNNLGLEPPDRRKRTASGFYSTSADVLEELRGQHPIVDWILEYRELAKLKSTYVDALPEEINPSTGRVHTSYNQTGSITGRLASSDPNLQNIPTRTEIGRRVRQAFITGPHNVLLSVDYSQIELRIVAHMAGDEAMLAAFRAGQDIHAATAAAIYNVPLPAVTKEQRRHAKAINFGLIYGMSAFGLSRTTDLTLGESEDFVLAYFAQFPGVKKYLDGIRRLAADQGYVETLLGRRRYFPGLKTQTNQNVRNREEREAINAPVQGTAADIMKLAMLQVPEALTHAGLRGLLLLQVHDELVLECPRSELIQTAGLVQQVMEGAYQLSIPLITEARWGKNWGQMSPLDSFSA